MQAGCKDQFYGYSYKLQPGKNAYITIHLPHLVDINGLARLLVNNVAVGAASDGALVEGHDVLGQGASLVTRNSTSKNKKRGKISVTEPEPL